MSSSPAVTEFENLLQSMLELRPPGVSGSKIRRLSEIAMQNFESESVLIQKLYTHFKRAPATHKLGALYVVDAIARAYQDEARKLGQVPAPSGAEGTPAAGVYHISDIIDNLMADIASAPADQKDKILKVVDIWERAATFSPELLASIRSHLAKPEGSTTPPYPPPSYLLSDVRKDGSAPAASLSAAPAPVQAAAAPSTSSILEALASMAKSESASAPAPPAALPVSPAKPNISDPSSFLSALVPGATNGASIREQKSPIPPQGQFSAVAAALQQPTGQTVSLPTTTPTPFMTSTAPVPDMSALLPFLTSGGQQPVPQPAQAQIPGFSFPVPPAQQLAAPQMDMQQQLMLMQMLISQGVPINQISTLLQAATSSLPSGAMPMPSAQGVLPTWPTSTDHDDRGRGSVRSPPYTSSRRSRSPRGRRRSSRSPSYHNRSPRGRRSSTPPRRYPDVEIRPKNVTFDPTMPSGCIKVLSRTLFVGGVPNSMSEDRLISIFEQAARVQGVIMNKDKRCAFMKVYYRSDAELIKATMETYTEDDVTLRCRWGVGFGPRDCCDYASGVSTIPIDRLTEADKRWVTSADFGGTGGRPLEPGLVVEEPDIEIGAGVSSKAISKRMPTNLGGDMGPKSTDANANHARGGRRRRR
ncbi:hypothetical protein V1525DRAFT_15982 [Lipomyces kononenkoae]|uniref:Uncharacterized protein n=1 Tax=Lipomyces kononenkoae TaxID=34357 RepID=A0ACC3T700_LIPKO